MKPFDDLSHEELIALTDDQIEHYRDLACAEAGAPLLPPEPGLPPEKPDMDKDVTLYKVGDFLFREQEQALRVAEAVRLEHPVETQYVSGPSYQTLVTGPASAPEVSTSNHFSRERWEAIRSEVEKYEREKNEWDSDQSEYRTASQKRADATSWIMEKIDEAHERQRNIDRFARLMERYLDLAEGDEATARRFLVAAHPEAEEFLPSGEPATSEVA